MKQLIAEEPRYSLTTLKALHYGATYSHITAHGILRVTFTDDSVYGVYQGNVLSIGPSGVFARTDDGMIKSDVAPARILHAEVI
jgi:hypothetical protein